MSGSSSSAPTDTVRPEPITLTVHSVGTPDLLDPEQAAQRRTVYGRVKMMLVLLVCAAPVVASYLTYYVIRPEGRSNYSTLILPTRGMPDLELRTLGGASVKASTLRGQWLLVAVGPAACDALCEKRLFMQRQLREMLGRDRDRLDKVWLITDDQPPASALLSALQGVGAVRALRVPRAAVAGWLSAADGHALEDHLYLVDPMGEWMMRVPVDPDPGRVKRDLDRVLRASAAWDTPGR